VAQDPALVHSEVVTVTILQTNDLHGHLEPDIYGRGGSAYMATAINDIRAAEGEENVVLMDAGDVYLGAAPISQLLLGESTIDIYNMLGYDVAAYGNHEFDKGQTVLISRTQESNFPWIGANIVLSGTEWTTPWWSPPYVTMTVGTTGTQVTLGIIGLDTDATPQITIKGATEGLVFKDLTETILYYYDEVKAQSDALIVMAHMGTEDSGSYKGLRTVAQELIDAGKPVDLMIGGHQHQALYEPVMVGDTAIIQAGCFGRWLGRADVTVDPATKSLSIVDYGLITITTAIAPDAAVEARVAYWADEVAPIVEQPVGSTYISLTRAFYAESLVGDLVTDGMGWKADQYDDGQVNGSVDIAFTNAGGLRADIEIPPGATLPYTITWGDTFNVMPFGNTLFLMDLTGAQIQALLDGAAAQPRGMLQNSGISWYWYNDCNCDTPTVWGAYGVQVNGEPLEYAKTYRVVTNNFSAARGIFAEGTNRWDTYYDMQEGVNEYIATISPIEASDIVAGRITKLDDPQPNLFTSRKSVVDADGDGIAQAGEILTYTITITNSGDYGAGIILTDTLPPGLTYVDDSLSVDFPGIGFTATVTNNVLTAHTEGYLSPPVDGSLGIDNVATIAFAAQVSAPVPEGDNISNEVELRDQFTIYAIPPAVIPLPCKIFLPLVMRNYS
jgi:5'-nucleotidase